MQPAGAVDETVDEVDDQPAEVPRREVGDPRVLRALAHPLRLSLLETLANLGQATATELSERVGESPANCSWHLRQLARYGFIEEAGGGIGRRRPWRWIPQRVSVAGADTPGEAGFRPARDAFLDVMYSRALDAWRRWWTADAPPAWSEAAFSTLSLTWLTAEELSELKRDFEALVDRHVLALLDRADPARRPAGSRPVRLVAWGFPVLEPGDEDDAA